MSSFDVVVVGGGAMGTAAARALATRGRHTLLLERFSFGHANGSSGGTTRIFRFGYDIADYVALAVRARSAWDELQDAAGEELLRETGCADTGPTAMHRADLLEAAGIGVERMTGAAARERWPALHLPDDEEVIYQADGGVLRATHAVLAQARLAREAGAQLQEHATVTAVEPAGDGVEVRTEDGDRHTASVAVISVGAWAGPLLRSIGIDLALQPTLEQSTFFRLVDPAPSHAGSPLPTLMDWRVDVRRPPYLVPDPFADEPGHFKAGLHHSGPSVDADTRTFEPDTARIAETHAWVRTNVGEAEDLARTETCLYTQTPDEDFVLERVGPLVAVSPCSGHGFKFAPMFGSAIADLATGQPPPFSLERFAVGRDALRVAVREPGG
jgi:sarcosine oxidase